MFYEEKIFALVINVIYRSITTVFVGFGSILRFRIVSDTVVTVYPTPNYVPFTFRLQTMSTDKCTYSHTYTHIYGKYIGVSVCP